MSLVCIALDSSTQVSVRSSIFVCSKSCEFAILITYIVQKLILLYRFET